MEVTNMEGIPEELDNLQEGAIPQTETNPELEEMLAGTPETPEQAAPQTGTDSEPESPEGDSPPQTENKTIKKRGRPKKTSENQTQSDTEAVSEAAQPGDGAKTRRKRPYTRPTMTVLSIDERPTVETDADKARNDLLDLLESQKTGRILTGTIQGVERPEDNPSRSLAVIYHGEFKVIIPAEEAVEPPSDYRGRLRRMCCTTC